MPLNLRVCPSRDTGVKDWSSNVTLKSGPCAHLDFRLEPAIINTLVVMNRGGAVIPDPRATGLRRGLGSGTLEWAAALDANSYQTTVSAEGHKDKTLLLNPKMPPSEVVLEEADMLSSRVVTESGDPIPGAIVTVFGNTRSSRAKTGRDGKFSLPLPPPPLIRFSVSRSGYTEQLLDFSSKPVSQKLEMRMHRPDTGLFGRVTDEDGNPVMQFTITFQDLSAPEELRFYARKFNTEDGRFSVNDVPAGIYKVSFWTEGTSWPTYLERFELKKGQFSGELTIRVATK